MKTRWHSTNASASAPYDASPRTCGKASGHFTPDINFTVGLISTASTSAAAMLKPATAPNSVGIGMETDMDSALPASQLPILVERNQIPIINPAARSGASLLIALRPTGL